MEWSIQVLEDLASIFWILDQTAGLLQAASHAEDPAVKPRIEQLAGVGDGGEGVDHAGTGRQWARGVPEDPAGLAGSQLRRPFPQQRRDAGLAGKFVHEFRELIIGEVEAGDSWFVQPAWSIESGIWAKGTFYDFMKGFFGWHNQAENVRVIAYFAYLVPVTWLLLAGGRTTKTTPVESADKVAVPVQ